MVTASVLTTLQQHQFGSNVTVSTDSTRLSYRLLKSMMGFALSGAVVSKARNQFNYQTVTYVIFSAGGWSERITSMAARLYPVFSSSNPAARVPWRICSWSGRPGRRTLIFPHAPRILHANYFYWTPCGYVRITRREGPAPNWLVSRVSSPRPMSWITYTIFLYRCHQWMTMYSVRAYSNHRRFVGEVWQETTVESFIIASALQIIPNLHRRMWSYLYLCWLLSQTK